MNIPLASDGEVFFKQEGTGINIDLIPYNVTHLHTKKE